MKHAFAPGACRGKRPRFSSLSVLVLAGLLTPAPGSAAAVRLYPVDDAARDSAFRSYVRKLASAVGTQNTAALRKLVDDEVVVGPGDDDKGWAKFVTRWRPDEHGDESVWPALSALLSLGFVQEHPRLFLSPYVVWRFPRGELNPAAHLVVVRDDAALREAPSARARTVASLSFEIVRALAPDDDAPGEGLAQWVRVRTLGVEGRTGYLDSRDLASPMMPRAQFGLKRGRWLLIALEGPQP